MRKRTYIIGFVVIFTLVTIFSVSMAIPRDIPIVLSVFTAGAAYYGGSVAKKKRTTTRFARR